jgi:lysophospholipid acyltransferase 1/2
MPSALEYYSYMFHFQAIMCGPVLFYRDYIDFIHGHRLLKNAPPSSVRKIISATYALFLVADKGLSRS